MLRQSMARRSVEPDPHVPITGVRLGERIKAAMERSGHSKTSLARELDVRWATVHDWIAKDAEPQADHIRRIAEVTGVTVDELLAVAEGQDPPFAAWRDFLAALERDHDALDAGERRALQSFAWPSGVIPTVGAYYGLLQAVRAAARRV